VFLNWALEFHVHVDASGIALGAILMHPRKEKMEHPIYFTNMKFSKEEHNYTTTERKD
jgi:hypothetical protein